MKSLLAAIVVIVLAAPLAFASHAVPKAVNENDVISMQVLDDPELTRVALLVEQEYNRISGLPMKYSFPLMMEVAVVAGETAEVVRFSCNCLGYTQMENRELHAVVALVGVSNLTKLAIFAHEFTHVMQHRSGTWGAFPSELLEMEAALVEQRVMLRWALSL
jgi:hypothetical protein